MSYLSRKCRNELHAEGDVPRQLVPPAGPVILPVLARAQKEFRPEMEAHVKKASVAAKAAVARPQTDDVVSGVGVYLVRGRSRPSTIDAGGVDRQLGVVRMVDQAGGVEVNVLDKDRSSDNTNGVLA
eukprot:8164934-Pyramimonas_sp.AAC.1